MINYSSPRLEEASRKWSHSKVTQLLYLGKRIRMIILTAVAFLTIRVTMATEKDDDKLLRVPKYPCGTPAISLVLKVRQGITLEVLADASRAVDDDANCHSGK